MSGNSLVLRSRSRTTGRSLKVRNNIPLKDYTLPVGERTCVMGILNVTPDSFSDGGRYLDPSRAVERAKQMAEEGADIIDIGGESSRPGSERVAPEEELERVMPVIRALRGIIGVPLSIDTYKSKVAAQALAEGVSVVNDITALRGDADMARTIAASGAGVILMHMKGDPKNMQDAPFYDDVMDEISSYLSESIALAVEAGVDPERIIIDPGIGFGKTTEHNLVILRELSRLKQLGKPVLIGTSRKAVIGTITGKEVGGRLSGTAASFTAAIINGADIIRVHDVDQMRDVTCVADAIMSV
ncbi:MAG: dihydropteroate synthase [Candidatus Makaraimicrobium thalassicum]|nr:MAG: dihydropteroate synthase [Candidatus Omnitrophota bacterium]